MSSPRATARVAGLLYVVMSALMVFNYAYVPATFIDGNDAAATARKIMEGESMYRLTILTALVAQILFVFVVTRLYELFRDVDRNLARLMLALVGVGIAADLVVIGMRCAPLVLLDGERYLTAFSQPQLATLSLVLLSVGGYLGRLITSLWGLWLFPFGILTIRSGWFPKILGVLLMLAGIGYITTCTAFIVAPAQLGAVTRVMMPLYFGELPMVFWLLIVGARVKENAVRVPSAA